MNSKGREGRTSDRFFSVEICGIILRSICLRLKCIVFCVISSASAGEPGKHACLRASMNLAETWCEIPTRSQMSIFGVFSIASSGFVFGGRGGCVFSLTSRTLARSAQIPGAENQFGREPQKNAPVPNGLCFCFFYFL